MPLFSVRVEFGCYLSGSVQERINSAYISFHIPVPAMEGSI
jgi:hypothetical protein